MVLIDVFLLILFKIEHLLIQKLLVNFSAITKGNYNACFHMEVLRFFYVIVVLQL